MLKLQKSMALSLQRLGGGTKVSPPRARPTIKTGELFTHNKRSSLYNVSIGSASKGYRQVEIWYEDFPHSLSRRSLVTITDYSR